MWSARRSQKTRSARLVGVPLTAALPDGAEASADRARAPAPRPERARRGGRREAPLSRGSTSLSATLLKLHRTAASVPCLQPIETPLAICCTLLGE
jgi:hypothetical protein